MKFEANLQIASSQKYADFYILARQNDKISQFKEQTVFVSCDDFKFDLAFPAKVHFSSPHGNDLYTYNIPKRFIHDIATAVAKTKRMRGYTVTITPDSRLN
ncbi:MAG: hypothetical protein HRO68_00475 [Nitrosopumilus sp.]|nr:hypothetical protein [Nitrosopumilus sp.]